MPDLMQQFRDIVYAHWRDHKRDLPWRHTDDPYHIYISEIMLQQTQVSRVIEKYQVFIQRFPSFETLAQAPVSEVLMLWQGLGYNRRALALKKAASIVVDQYSGSLPKDLEQLIALPGIGKATAAAIMAYAFNEPVVFIETNIRRAFIHHFFEQYEEVSDAALIPLVEQALDRGNPRQWYSALMDYGTQLAKTVPNPNRRSKHYAKQSAFIGSKRQLRGRILHILLQQALTRDQLQEALKDDRLDSCLEVLTREGFIVQDGTNVSLRS